MRQVILCMLFCLASLSAGAQQRFGVVDADVATLYHDADYESSIETQVLMGAVVEIVGSDRYWLEIITPDGYKAWTNEMNIVEMSDAEIKAYTSSERYICTAEHSVIYEKAFETGSRIGELTMGDILRKSPDEDKFQSALGFFKVVTPAGKTGFVRNKDVTDFKIWATTRKPKPEHTVELAKKLLGGAYLWGGNTFKGVDCSGMVQLAYFMEGVIVPRNASKQTGLGEDVKIKNLKAGDLVFFGKKAEGDEPQSVGHVGIFIGGNRFIHSSQRVRISSIKEEDPDFYDSKDLLFARRLEFPDNYGDNARNILEDWHYFTQE